MTANTAVNLPRALSIGLLLSLSFLPLPALGAAPSLLPETSSALTGLQTWYRDADTDGYGDPDVTRRSPRQPSGYVAQNGDCDDTNSSVHPNAPETCDGIDENCEGQVDEGLPTQTWYEDEDADGYGSPASPVTACGAPDDGTLYVLNASDCNDLDDMINPAAYEIKNNGRDEDCDQVIDEKVIHIEAGNEFSLALMSDGSVWSWGQDDSGRLGNGPSGSTTTPTKVNFPNNARISLLCAGDYHAIAVDSYGYVYAWGSNMHGQLGNGSTTYSDKPTAVKNFYAPAAIACGGSHTLAIKSGTLYAWGSNEYGQVGDGTSEDRLVPTLVSLGGLVHIAGGWLHSFAVDNKGAAYAWGYNNEGQLGLGYVGGTVLTPTAIPKLTSSNPTAWMAGGSEHSAAITTDGRTWTWGDNNFSELGDCTTTDHASPFPLTSLNNRPATQVDAGMRHTLLLMTDRSVYVWGAGSYGALGYGGTTSSSCPLRLSSLYNIQQVSAGKWHSLALAMDGTVYAWGQNKGGELGNGNTTQQNSPVKVVGF